MNKAEFNLVVENLLNKFKQTSYNLSEAEGLINEFECLVSEYREYVNIFALENVEKVKEALRKAHRRREFDKFDRAMNLILGDVESLRDENSFPD